MEDQKFDELARKLATPITRRQAVKMVLVTALGGLLIRSGSGEAFADNSDCAHFCNDIYRPGDERGHCKSDAAHGTGVCATCGPAAPAGHPDVCAVGTQGAFCCPAATPTCCNNATCVNPQTDVLNCGACGHVCGRFQVYKGGTCVTPSVCAAPLQCPFPSFCGPNFCACFTRVNGQPFCGQSISCATAVPCTTDADCPTGTACTINTCCGAHGICEPPCPTGFAPVKPADADVPSGPTSSGQPL